MALAVGYAQQVQTGPLHELWVMIISYPGMLMAATAMGLLIMVAASSYRRARQKMRYETWWIVHLYAYIAAALSFTHQLSNGVPFIDHPIARAYWIALWAFTAGAVIFYRWAVPIARSLYHRLRVVAVEEEAPGVISVIMSGRHIDRLPATGRPIPAVALPEPRHVVDGAPLLALRPARRGQRAHHRQAARPPQHVGRRPAAGDARCHRGPLWRLHAPGSAH